MTMVANKLTPFYPIHPGEKFLPEKKDGSLSDDHEKSQDYKDEAPRYISLSDCNRDRFETDSFHAPLQDGDSAQWHRNSLYP